MTKTISTKKPVLKSAAAKEQQALHEMYDYFKNNRALMPANITTQRDFVIAQLLAGRDVAEVYAQAIANANALVELKPLPKIHVIRAKGTAAKAA
jgi:hypothetical protein